MNVDEQTLSKSSVSCSPPPSLNSENSELFNDTNCGEPLLSQRIVLNFISDEEQDTDAVQRKCVAFWDFVSRNPDLLNLATVPDYNIFDTESSSPNSSYVSKKTASPLNQVVKEKTAVSMLELVEKKGLIDRAFECKMARSYCSLAGNEYGKHYIAQDKGCDETKKSKEQRSSPVLKKICRQLDAWDKIHPHYNKPPGHSQTLIYCKKSRNVT